MAKKPTKPINKESAEPSDDDLELLEDEPEELIAGAELDTLLHDVFQDSDDEASKDNSLNSKVENILNMALGDDSNEELAKSLIGESVTDELDTDDTESDDETDEEEQEFEEFDEFAGDNDLGDDSNFDSTEASDPRYPEY